jgi:integrase
MSALTVASAAPPTRVPRRRRRGQHFHDGRVTSEDRTRLGPDGKRVKYRVWGFTVGSGATGPTRRKKTYREDWTREDAQAALDEEREARRSGLGRPTDRMPERTWLQMVEEYIASKRGRMDTITDHQKILQNRVPRVLGNPRLRDVTGTMIARYEQTRREEGRTNNTLRNELSAVRQVFKLARKLGYLRTIPEIESPPPGEARERYLTEPEAERLLAACVDARNPELPTIVALALNTGLRLGNILNLRWSWLDFSTARITIPRPKNRKPLGLPMSPAVDALFMAHTPTEAERTGFVFKRGRTGKAPLIRRAYENAVERAGIEDFTFHDLRHTAASLLIQAGATLQEVKEILGHRDYKSTLRYAHLNPGRLRDAMGLLKFRLPTNGPASADSSSRSETRSDEGVRIDEAATKHAESLARPRSSVG